MNKIFQCCYTNDISDISGNISSGWRTVAVSLDIPQDALETCEKLQNANSSITSEMADEFGNVLNLEEISGDGNYIYVIKTKYGMSDRLGRANMFSHAFIFPCRSAKLVEDPNTFLAIEEADFKDNKEEAEKSCNIPHFFVKNEGYKIRDVLDSCRIGENEYRTLLYCVYAHISEQKIPRPLFVEYDGTWRNRRELLYCIYFGLPFSVRRRLSSASCSTANTTEKNIIFTVKARNKEHYIIPQTGENNVLSPRLEKRLSRYGFVDYAADNYKDAGLVNYFTELETKAMELGDETAHDKLFLKIAHLLITDQGISSLSKISDDELDARLSDALRTQSLGNSVMDGYIAVLLNEIRQREHTLTDEMETLLKDRVDNSTEESLINMVGKCKKPVNTVDQDCVGDKAGDGDTWEKLEKEASELSNHVKNIVKGAWNLYNQELLNIHSGDTDAIPSAYYNYIDVVKKITILSTDMNQVEIIAAGYASLPKILRNKGAKTFFEYVNGVFACMDKLAGIGVFDKEFERERLLRHIKIKNNNLSKSFDEWYRLSCCISRTAMEILLEMFDAYNEGKRREFEECYKEFCNICEGYDISKDIRVT